MSDIENRLNAGIDRLILLEERIDVLLKEMYKQNKVLLRSNRNLLKKIKQLEDGGN